ncbi:MAG: RluA family pseudouridine synthase [Candidatus Ancillula sp.]|jgi:23S rRNA pseudouridine1911/1915/1917 synthase|nr:RluA family pseudouridine synthase [Candidatus Ancillula sp.]
MEDLDEKSRDDSPKLALVYQDEDIVVVNKPAGMIAHKAESFRGPDVCAELAALGVEINTSGDKWRQGVVSRLDVGTTGLMVLAKNEDTFQKLKGMFSAHEVEKEYLALVHGILNKKRAKINAPIGRHPNNRLKFAVVDDGKTAVTRYEVDEEFEHGGKQYSLLRVHPETGRTHQIRVHFSALKHPLVGDTVYGRAHETFGLQRPFLHARRLAFEHPTTHERLTFEAVLNEDLLTTLHILHNVT